MPPKAVAGLGRKGAAAKPVARKAPTATEALEQSAPSASQAPRTAPATNSRAPESASPEIVAILIAALKIADVDYQGPKSLEERAEDLANLRDKRGALFINPKTKPFIPQVAGMVQCIGFERAYEYLAQALRDGVSRQKIFLQSPTMRAAQAFAVRRVSNLTRETQITVGLYRCGKCGSNNTRSVQKMTRSADEPFTNFITCMSCNNHWRD